MDCYPSFIRDPIVWSRLPNEVFSKCDCSGFKMPGYGNFSVAFLYNDGRPYNVDAEYEIYQGERKICEGVYSSGKTVWFIFDYSLPPVVIKLKVQVPVGYTIEGTTPVDGYSIATIHYGYVGSVGDEFILVPYKPRPATVNEPQPATAVFDSTVKLHNNTSYPVAIVTDETAVLIKPGDVQSVPSTAFDILYVTSTPKLCNNVTLRSASNSVQDISTICAPPS